MLREGLTTELEHIIFAGKAGWLVDFRKKYTPFQQRQDWIVEETQMSQLEIESVPYQYSFKRIHYLLINKLFFTIFP